MTTAFEWDESKAKSNVAAHGVSFEQAKGVFRDPLAVERQDDRHEYGEDRFIITGMSDASLLTVAFTEREERIRIISARHATRREQDDYYTQPR